MKILITGGAGFIGSHLVDFFVKNRHEVVVLDNLSVGNKLCPELVSQVHFVADDVRNREMVINLSEGCDVIIHLAAILGVDRVIDNPRETMDVEIEGTKNVILAAIQHNIKKIIYASTSGIYSDSNGTGFLTEDMPVAPTSSYAVAKRYNEVYFQSVYKEFGINSASLRFFNIYGPRQDNRMVIPIFIEQSAENRNLTVFGNGSQTRDFTYVDDVVTAINRLLEFEGCEIFNIANEQDYTMLDLAGIVKKITNSDSEIVMMEPEKSRIGYEVKKRLGNSRKLLGVTGFAPGTTLEEGLKKILQYNSK